MFGRFGWLWVLGVKVTMAALLVAGCTIRGEPAKNVLVMVSIPPLADFVREVGGDRVQVEVMVPPGASPHVYEPLPAQLQSLSKARLLVLNGIGLEFWADKAVGAAANPGLLVVTTADGLEILEDEDEHEGEQAHAAGNPHVWLDPLNAIHQVERIRDGLAQVDPEGASAYQANAERYITQLRLLDQEIRAQVATFSSRKFIAFHAAYGYFAQRYGLEQVVIEQTPGREPSPRELAQVVEVAKALGARVVFAEPQFSSKAAEVIAAETGARVAMLDPLGQPPHYNYLETMRYNVAQLAQALR